MYNGIKYNQDRTERENKQTRIHLGGGVGNESLPRHKDANMEEGTKGGGGGYK
jgi:hypothetical protein